MTFTLEAEHAFGPRLRARRHRMDNGLGLVLLEDPSAPIVSYQSWYRVGSRHERPGATGIAHLFEHLMFNRTRSLGPGEIDRLIEQTGGDANAATWVDWTFYRDTVPARDLELAIRVEADRMQNLILDPAVLESEREVVIHERMMRVEDDVEGFLDEELFRLAFARHPYHWPTIGWMEDIRGLTLEEVQRFYRTYYAANNVTLVVVGDVDEQALLELVERHYGDLEPAEIPQDRAEAEPAQQAERRAVFRKPTAAPRALYGYRAPAQADPDWAALSFVAALLTAGPSARLYRRLVIERELCTHVDCATVPFRDPSLFRIEATMIAGVDPAEVEREIEAALAALATRAVPDEEIAKVRNLVETDFWAELDSSEGKAEALGHYETALGDFRLLFDQEKQLASVSAEDVARVAARYLRPEQRTAILALPEEGDG